MKLKAILNLAIGAAMAAGLGAVTAPPASAAPRDGFCEVGEFCYYYNTGLTNSVSDFTTSVANYGTDPATCYVFKTPGYAGYGQCIKNNAAAVYNMSGQTVRIYYYSNFNNGVDTSAAYLDIAPGEKRNLSGTALYNQNASHKFMGAPATTTYPVGDDYPYRGASKNAVDPWNFYKTECTSFAAWAVNSRLGIPFHNYYKGPQWGNAYNWDNAARSAGISVTGTPRAGDVAVRNSGTYGHVAFVTSVNSDGSFEIDEYNRNGTHVYSHRRTTIGTASAQFDSFIHLKG
jgi:surface antigen